MSSSATPLDPPGDKPAGKTRATTPVEDKAGKGKTPDAPPPPAGTTDTPAVEQTPSEAQPDPRLAGSTATLIRKPTVVAPPVDAGVQVVYRGVSAGPSDQGAFVEVLVDGESVGLLPHVAKHSPSGMAWGYGGSGPADLARSLLIHALGEAALCPDCRGAGRVRYPDEKHPDKPAPAPRGSEGYSWPCRECDGGYRVRYQAYKAEVVQTLAPTWEIDRDEIIGWNLLSVGR